MNKNIYIVLLLFLPLFSGAQDYGYFGKKNLLGIHGSWFFRGMPQYFYAEKMYRYDESSNDLRKNSLRNHVWHGGFSYRRILNKSHAIGIQVDYSLRNLGDPIHDGKKSNYASVWAPSSQDLYIAWSNELQQAVRMSDINFTPSSFSVLDVKLIWSRTRTLSVLPLGLTSTWGLGYQQMNMNYAKTIYASAYTFDIDNGFYSADRTTFQLNEAPQDLKNSYFGIGWMWDLSLNYALSKSLIFSIGSDIRGVFMVQKNDVNSSMLDVFPPADNTLPSVEGMIHGRDFSKEIRKEMLFQNTFRFGLTLAF